MVDLRRDSILLHGRMNHPLAVFLIFGAVSGGIQAVLAAPVESLRLRIENGAHNGWSVAWKGVFVGTHACTDQVLSCENLRDARRGNGWRGWGLCKDIVSRWRTLSARNVHGKVLAFL